MDRETQNLIVCERAYDTFFVPSKNVISDIVRAKIISKTRLMFNMKINRPRSVGYMFWVLKHGWVFRAVIDCRDDYVYFTEKRGSELVEYRCTIRRYGYDYLVDKMERFIKEYIDKCK